MVVLDTKMELQSLNKAYLRGGAIFPNVHTSSIFIWQLGGDSPRDPGGFVTKQLGISSQRGNKAEPHCYNLTKKLV